MRYLLIILVLSVFITGCLLKNQKSIVHKNTINFEKPLKSMACWATWRSKILPLKEIPWKNLTHLYYSFSMPRADGSLDVSHLKYTDELVKAGHKHGVKIILSVGGANGSKHFVDIVADENKIERFVGEILKYIDEHNMDGMDLDWEYWPEDGTINYSWSEGYLKIARKLKAGLETKNRTLSISVFASDWYGKNLKTELINAADWFLVMAFDNAGSWSIEQHHSTFSLVKESLDYWERRVGSENRSKLVVTVPFYGRGFEKNYSKGGYSYSLPYVDIIEDFKDAHKHDFYSSNKGNIYYNGRDTIRKKAQYIKNNGYAGVIAWELSMDSKNPKKALMPVIAEVLK